jgi:predicted aspartyl protease
MNYFEKTGFDGHRIIIPFFVIESVSWNPKTSELNVKTKNEEHVFFCNEAIYYEYLKYLESN